MDPATIMAIGKGVGAVAGGISGGKGKGGQRRAPKWAGKQAKFGGRMLLDAARRSPEEAIAGFNGDQTNAFQMVRDSMGLGAPELADASARMAEMSRAGISPADIQKFMNPYTSDVIDASFADIERNRARRQLGASAEAEAAGAFGGDREAVYRANIDGEYDRTSAMTAANLRARGFDTAAGLAAQDYGLRMTGNEQLAALIDARRRAAFTDAAALEGVGNTQQGQAQRYLDYPLNIGQLLQGGAAQFFTQGKPSEGGGIDGTLKGILGGMNTVGDIIKSWPR